MTHTPGPWNITGITSWAMGGPVWKGRKVYCIEDKIEATKGGALSFAYTEANARLIAAAPDLLEALKLARQDVFHHVPAPIDAAHLAIIDAAIAKAEGK